MVPRRVLHHRYCTQLGLELFSGLDAQLFQHAIGKTDDEISLPDRAIGKAGALHARQASNEEFQLDPIRTQFHRKNMRLAVMVLELGIAQEMVRDSDPENLI